MADMFEEYDSYIGKLNISDPSTIKDMVPTKEKTQSFEKDVRQGFGSALVGTPGDIEMLGRGAAKYAEHRSSQFMQTLSVIANTIGMEEFSQKLDKLYSSEQNKTALEALLEGLQQDTVLPTTEDVQTYLKDNYDVQFDSEGATLFGELLAPGGYFKAGKKGVTKVKEMIGK